MPLTLHPIAPAELDEFVGHFRERYITERMQADHFTRQQAAEFVAIQWQAIVPLGTATPGHHFLWAVDSSTDPRTAVCVGLVWLYVNDTMRQAFLYQIEVFEAYRSRGYGRQLLAAAKEWAKVAGARTIALNVFATNSRAIALYNAAGFVTVSHGMTKPLVTD